MSAFLRTFFESVFTRHFGLVVLFGLTVIAYSLSRAASALISAPLAVLAVPGWVERPTALQESASGVAAGDAIRELLTVESQGRETIGVVVPHEEPALTDVSGFVSARQGCPPSSAEAVLVGTMVDREGVWSYGIVQDRLANRTAVVTRGMLVGGARVTAVEPQRLWVDNQGREECLEPNVEPAPSSARGRATSEPNPPERHGRPGRNGEEEATTRSGLSAGIERQSRSEYTIDRSLLDSVLDSPSILREHAPVFSQHVEANRPDGILIERLPGDSVFRELGLRPGDILHAVNGRRITSVQRGVDLVEALRSEDRVEVELEQRGRTRTLVFTVR